MTFEGMGEIFEGYFADTGAGKFLLVPTGGQAEGLACADPGARNPLALAEIQPCARSFASMHCLRQSQFCTLYKVYCCAPLV